MGAVEDEDILYAQHYRLYPPAVFVEHLLSLIRKLDSQVEDLGPGAGSMYLEAFPSMPQARL